MGDTEPVKPGSESVDNGKRDREYGMFQDPLVMERTKELKDGMNRELRTRREEGRLTAIYAFVGQHRPGKPTGIRPPIRGSYNVVFIVDFTDGSALLRVGLPGNVISPDEKVRAEVATMRYVEKMTSIPVPHVYHWGTAAENPLGLGPFIIMEYIPHHQSLCDVLKDPTVEDPTKAYLDPDLPRDKLARMYQQAAGIILQLSQLEMPRIGSLRQDGRDSFSVASRPLTQDMNDLVVQGGIPLSVLPPEDTTYGSADEWYAALADLHVAHLTFQHNGAVEAADDCRDKFVARHLYRQRARAGGSFGMTKPHEQPHTESQGQKTEKFRLWLDDLRPQNILVDADLNVVGVIDWEWAYFAPESYVQDPPWWLLIERPEYWCGTILEFRDEFVGVLDVFLEALRVSEDGKGGQLVLQRTAAADGDGAPDSEWSIDRHIEALNINADTTVRLSHRMRQNWDSGTFWANYAARKCYGFEPVFWEFLDERFFGRNVEGGYEGRMHLLSAKAKRRMELFVERKMEEMEDEKIVDWDAGEAKAYLAEILADLDQ